MYHAWGKEDIGFWWESQQERDHYEDLVDVGGKITLRWILEK
jgi:hypothetical protein